MTEGISVPPIRHRVGDCHAPKADAAPREYTSGSALVRLPLYRLVFKGLLFKS